MVRARVRIIGEAGVVYALLGAFTLVASYIGGEFNRGVAFLVALPALGLGLFLLVPNTDKGSQPITYTPQYTLRSQSMMGGSHNPYGDSRQFSLTMPRSEGQAPPPNISGVRGREAAEPDKGWLSAKIIGVAMVTGAVLWIATTYLVIM